MAGNSVPHRQGAGLDRRAMLWLYPQLRALPPEAWPSLLRNARDTSFDAPEWLGVVAGTAFVAWLLDSGTVLPAIAPGPRGLVMQFFIALPLLALVVGPVYLRRTRRGLERERVRMQRHNGSVDTLTGRKEA